jgi:hypothetical protein
MEASTMSRPLFGSNPRRPRSIRPAVEALEERCVPTTTVNNANGVLTITGDGGNNAIVVSETATAGTYTVKANDLAGTVTAAGVTSIVVSTGAGNDLVNFVGNAADGTALTGTLSVTGDDTLTVGIHSNFNVTGAVTVSDTGSGRLRVAVAGPGTTLGGATVTGGSGNDSFSIQNGATVNGNLSLDLGDGDNTVNVGAANVGATTITGTLGVVGGAGNDVVAVSSASTGAEMFDLGSGNDTVTVLNTTVSGNFSAVGTGNEAVTLAGDTVSGFVSVNDPTAQSVDVSVNHTSVGTFLGVVGGAGNDTVVVHFSSIGQNLGAILGGGNDSVSFTSDTVAGNVTLTGTGNETYSLTADTVVGFVSVNDPAATAVTVTANGTRVGSFLGVVGGAGNDTVNVTGGSTGENLGAILGGGNDSVSYSGVTVTGNVTLTGTGNETYSLTNDTVLGFVSLNDPGAASLAADVSGTTAGSYLAIIAGDGANTVTVTDTTVGQNFAVLAGAGSNAITVTGLQVTGNATLSAGDGTDSLSFWDSLLGGATTIVLGNGNDTVNVESGGAAAANGTSTQFVGPVSLTTGSGNDVVNLGQTGGDTVIFFQAGASTFTNGGGGTLNQNTTQYLSGKPTVTGWKVVNGS